MSNSVILLIETATKNCSVAVCRNGFLICELSEKSDAFIHAEKLHVLINKAIRDSGLTPKDIGAVAVSKGPGSYTGLRIGVSAAKGLAFALDISLLAINTLELMCDYGQTLHPDMDFYCGLMDARRDEVYMAVFDNKGREVMATTSAIMGNNPFAFGDGKRCCFIGDGVKKCEAILPASSIGLDVLPSASMMMQLATTQFKMGIFENTDTFEPYYLKDFIPGIAKRSLLN
ncbi:MAG: tRNA (adenosine(37)-N6)-threonylcarbamoyltransferase complex dimerization subunit type 1 TsaB [Flavobacteriales bacterium]